MRGVGLAALAGLALAACSPSSVSDPPGAESVILEPVRESARWSDLPSALDLGAASPALPQAAVEPRRIISGGAPPDGIPPIDQPRFEPASDVRWLSDSEPVIALSLDGENRAYPVQILIWHEIVNDTVGGRPIAVTYCPLCNSALAFDRQVGGILMSFGTSGLLYLSALVMYDRQTESLWSQVERRAIAGVLTGSELDLVPVSTVRWADWLAAHPDGWVLSRQTGFSRDYGRNPYVQYDTREESLLDATADDRFPPKERVVTFPGADEAVAVLLTDLATAQVGEVTVDGEPVVLFAAPGLASSLDTASIEDGRQIAATGAFRPWAGGRLLTFGPSDGDVSAERVVAIDAETGSGWDLLGRSVTGPLAGEQLERIAHLDTFWFAQAAFRPDTRVVTLGR